MSAYICDTKHIAALAAYAANNEAAIYDWRQGTCRLAKDKRETAAQVAAGLMAENVRNVKARYGDNSDLPGPCKPDGTCYHPTELASITAKQARDYIMQFPDLKDVDVLNMTRVYSYQACETEDWPATKAALQIERITNAAIRRLPGGNMESYEEYHGQLDKTGPAPICISDLAS